MELTAILENPAPIEASWCVLCSYRSGFEGGGAVIFFSYSKAFVTSSSSKH
jgi:hypothetical protein